MIHDPDTLNALLDSVERFVRERLVPAEHVVQETDEIPEDIVAEMKELGLFGLTILMAAWASRWRKRRWSLW